MPGIIRKDFARVEGGALPLSKNCRANSWWRFAARPPDVILEATLSIGRSRTFAPIILEHTFTTAYSGDERPSLHNGSGCNISQNILPMPSLLP
jgi:hypothetical protein